MLIEVLGADIADADRASIAALANEFSPTAPALTDTTLDEILTSGPCSILVARADSQIVGMLTLVMFALPTIRRAWIEDVLVTAEARRRGIATALVQEAVNQARSAGVQIVDLTSRPSREAANALYRKLGFKQRETNVYRFDLRIR